MKKIALLLPVTLVIVVTIKVIDINGSVYGFIDYINILFLNEVAFQLYELPVSPIVFYMMFATFMILFITILSLSLFQYYGNYRSLIIFRYQSIRKYYYSITTRLCILSLFLLLFGFIIILFSVIICKGETAVINGLTILLVFNNFIYLLKLLVVFVSITLISSILLLKLRQDVVMALTIIIALIPFSIDMLIGSYLVRFTMDIPIHILNFLAILLVSFSSNMVLIKVYKNIELL